MSRISVFGAKRDLSAVIEELHTLGAYHINEYTGDELDIGDPLERAEEIDEALVTAKSLISQWKLEDGIQKPHLKISSTINKIRKIEEKNRNLVEKKAELEQEIRQLEQASETLKLLKELDIDPELLHSLESVEGFVGTVDSTKELRQSLDKVTKKYDFKESGRILAAFVASEASEEFLKVLRNFGFQEIDTSSLQGKKDVKTELKTMKAGLSQLIARRGELIKDNKEFLLQAVRVLTIASEKAEAPLKFASSENTFYVEGYIPDDRVDEMKKRLTRATKSRISIKTMHIKNQDEVPIELEHTRPVKPYQFFMDLYSLPRYAEVDPTILTFITFPILFGFMLGDTGYGVITLILFLFLRKLAPGLGRLPDVLIFASIWTIIFGVLFGEVFGMEVVFGHDLWRVMSRLHQINDLLIVSLAVGAIHVNIGLAFGFYNELKAHGLKAAIFEKGSWFVLEAAAALLGISYLYGSFPMWYGYMVLGISVVMLFLGEGIKGIIELPSIFSNILSYARLMAIGLASASLAVVVNDFAGQFFSQGIKGWLPAVLLLIVGHVINILLGLLGPFLHSLRLHYVEFFTKFYKGGGKPFAPFGIGGR